MDKQVDRSEALTERRCGDILRVNHSVGHIDHRRPEHTPLQHGGVERDPVGPHTCQSGDLLQRMNRHSTVARQQIFRQYLPERSIVGRAHYLHPRPQRLAYPRPARLRQRQRRTEINGRRYAAPHYGGAAPDGKQRIKILLSRHTVIDIRHRLIDQPPHSPGTQILGEHTHHRHDRLGRSPAVGHQSAVGESGVGVKHIPLYIARHDCREATCATEYDRRVGKPSGVIVHIAAVEQKSAVF